MKKHHLIAALIPIVALASCAPTTPVITHIPAVSHAPHAHNHTPNKVVETSKPTPKSNVTKLNPTIPEPVPFISTHGIPGQPC